MHHVAGKTAALSMGLCFDVRLYAKICIRKGVDSLEEKASSDHVLFEIEFIMQKLTVI